jgi:V8-like Glu-specific endopeptidase
MAESEIAGTARGAGRARGFPRWMAPALASLALISCGSPVDRSEGPVATAQSGVVYGEDDRVELADFPDDALRELARARVAAVMAHDTLSFDGHSVKVVARSLGEAANLCEGERFADQPSAALCSAILLDDRTVLTAGHCMRRIACSDAMFVLGYFLQPNGAEPVLNTEDVYGCQEVLARTLSLPTATERIDFAWVRLDRPVHKPAPPVVLRPASAPLQVGETVTVAGFSGGTPMKVRTGGRVADPRPDTLDFFVTTSDTFHGDSGAPVFDGELRLLGLHVRGNADYAATPAGCNTVSRLPDEPTAAGEENTYVARTLVGLCESRPESVLCCSPLQPCAHVDPRAAASCSVGERTNIPFGSSLTALALIALMTTARRTRC